MYSALDINEVITKLESSFQGISDNEAATRRKKVGWNQLPRKKTSILTLVVNQFKDVLVYILVGALGLSLLTPLINGEGFSGESLLDASVILAILLLNALLGFLQEYKAEEAIAELRKLSAPRVRVRREGIEQIIRSKELVPGDIMILEAGDRVSADARLIKLSQLRTNESSLTGEAIAVSKHLRPVHQDAGLADQNNMVFSGTLVTAGTAEAIVVATGVSTQLGKIAKLVASTKLPQTPLEKRMRKLSSLLGLCVIGLCVLVVVIGLIRGLPVSELLLIGVSLAVSAVPEGLPAVVTVCLALGVRRMAKSKALVRRLEALEALGAVTVICADKTGTITENRMRVTEHWLADGFNVQQLAHIAASCNRAVLPNIGDPTEIGLLEFAADLDTQRLEIVDEEVPFSSEKQYMQTKHIHQGMDVVYLKGAPEKILQLCEGQDISTAEKHAKAFAQSGLRVLACATASSGTTTLVGLLALEDPPRETVARAIEQAKTAGIQTKMITGDHLETAKAIAAQVGIEGGAITGQELKQMSKHEFPQAVRQSSVFARISPAQKLAILQTLKEHGEVVAMSGDGVNDAPALKGAHIGIAMGKNGTDVAREASSIVLADDHYGTIVAAIREGRRIYDNIRKFVVFLLRANLDELLFITVAILIGIPLPYLPLHILWLNLMTDSLPALALGMEPAEPDVMQRTPTPHDEHLLHGEWTRLILIGLWGFAVSLVYYLYLLSTGFAVEEARTAILMLAILVELTMALNVRSRRPIWEIGFFSNKFLVWALAFPIALQGIIIYTPLSSVFHVVSLSTSTWVQIIAITIISFLVLECSKLCSNRTYAHNVVT